MWNWGRSLICLAVWVCWVDSAQLKNFYFPKKGCLTTTGEAGVCKDVHLCQEALIQLAKDFIFPTICDFSRNTIKVCCSNSADQCGVSFPWEEGLEGVLDTNSIDSNDHDDMTHTSLRRPPEQEALFDMAVQRFGYLFHSRKKRGFLLTPNLDFAPIDNETNIRDQDHNYSVEQNPIVNGKDARRAEYPWAVILGKFIPSGDKRWFCGGSLISDRWVVTAAHCLSVKVEVVRLGETRLDLDVENVVDSRVDKLIPHPQYRSDRLYHDIALIKLKTTVKFQRNIQPICLPPPKLRLSLYEELVTCGWGHDSYGGRAALRLRQTRNLKYVPRKKCNQIFEPLKSRLRMPQGLTRRTICAFDEDYHSDACQGDSGGGLMQYNPGNKQHTLVGIVAAGIGCGSDKYPGIYTDVRDYMKWITREMKRN